MTVIGAKAATIVLSQLADMLARIHEGRATVYAQVEAPVEAHPSSPGPDVFSGGRYQDRSTDPHRSLRQRLPHRRAPGLLRRPDPVTWRSGSSIRADRASRKGNKVLKRTLYLSAFAALKDPLSRDYYDRKLAEGKHHNQALIALGRRRCDTLYAMLRDGTLYQEESPTAA